jgi:chemotaxis protein MotA
VFGAVVAGYLMEPGKLHVWMQPAELITIGGAAIGTVLIANPIHILKKIASGVASAFGSSKYGKQKYMDTLKMMYKLFTRARRDGLMALESDSDDPEGSTIFSKYPQFLANRYALALVCDSIRMASSGGIDRFDADQIIENDMEVHHPETSTPIESLTSVVDSLPGLGIVAAVLGVVITMGSLGGPPEEIGKKVAAALVGTFLGILLCYGLVGPLAADIPKAVDDEHAYYQVLRVMIVAFMKGTAPSLALEIGRRAIPGRVRLGFHEAEMYIKDKNSAPVAVAA